MSWSERFESVRVRRELEHAAYAKRTSSHENHKQVYIHRKCRGGSSQFWLACDDCRVFVKSNPIRRSQVPNWKDLPVMTPSQIDEYRDPGNAPRVDISRRYSEEWWSLYAEYLESSEWKLRRREVMRRDNGTCQSCGNPAEQVHHMTYERIGNEDMEDLLAICRRCHRLAHKH